MPTSSPTIDRLEPGDAAPDFEAPTQDGDTLRLSDYRGQYVALYFYPKDGTAGCTKQACNLRDGYASLQDAGIAVIGVSEDDVASHEDFAAEHDLPFPLVADPEHEILEAYGVYGERQMYGNTFMGTQRTTYLIGPDGTIEHVFKRPKTDRHASEILQKFEALTASQ
jgi:peroxiredoxin Q/BCP